MFVNIYLFTFFRSSSQKDISRNLVDVGIFFSYRIQVSLLFCVNFAVIIIWLIDLFGFHVILIRYDVPVFTCLDPFVTAFTHIILQETTFCVVRATWQMCFACKQHENAVHRMKTVQVVESKHNLVVF